MKKTVILLILLFSSLHIYAQQQENQLYELINVSLEKYLEIKQFPKDKQRKPIDLSKVYLNTINYPPEFEFSQKIKDTGIHFININNRKDRKGFSKSKYVIQFYTPVLHGNTITIRFVDFGVRARGKWVYMQPGTDGTYLWMYSCEMGEWELVSMDYE